MKLILAVITILFVTSCASKIEYQGNKEISKTRKSAGFVFGTNDIPVLLGLEIVDEESTTFDTMSGNITIASYFTYLPLDEVKDFYMITLPQVGYRVDSENGNISYKRGKDNLEVSFEKKKEELIVKFLMSSN